MLPVSGLTSGALEGGIRAGQGGVAPEEPGGGASCPQLADQHGEGGAGEGQGEAG